MDEGIDLYDSLGGQVALVTGATRGIGAEIATQLAEQGATVYAGARDTDDVEDAALVPVRLDVTNERTIEDAVERIESEEGRLDVLVNNAAVYGPSGALHTLSTADIDRTLDTNLRGPMLVTKHALPLLLERRGVRVVDVSSGSGQFAGGMSTSHPPYSVSKAGLNALTAYLDAEYGPALIANAVCPGWVRTDMGGAGATRSAKDGAETVWLARFEPGSPSGRLWRDKEVVDW
ncbi:SDR family NAD(P)-dependent oxidoreductase [Halomarina oriensis]|uniref:SDR family NAD(P)-dependent oxidoreductase n=1 Tax=Halomarina oriensis TaxID=671145 RepID=A0A6B0GR53_9EURY|nr:SDR family NAD(P)-dependent oxidoreductase [Halomarina oriensis]MWG34138.1 SDR family NAD(P)-dependent oxidoreductase [Halomarina oriensis]